MFDKGEYNVFLYGFLFRYMLGKADDRRVCKGDIYIRDLKNTKGHITGQTCEQWHPTKKKKHF